MNRRRCSSAATLCRRPNRRRQGMAEGGEERAGEAACQQTEKRIRISCGVDYFVGSETDGKRICVGRQSTERPLFRRICVGSASTVSSDPNRTAIDRASTTRRICVGSGPDTNQLRRRQIVGSQSDGNRICVDNLTDLNRISIGRQSTERRQLDGSLSDGNRICVDNSSDLNQLRRRKIVGSFVDNKHSAIDD